MQTVTYPVRVMVAFRHSFNDCNQRTGGVNETYTPGI